MVGITVWLTGLSGSGKTTIGTALVHQVGGALLLDGDAMRSGLNSDLGYTRTDRAENVRRLGEVALMLSQNGLIAVVAAISPYSVDRNLVRARHRESGVSFVEAFVSTPLNVCERRDPKQLYRAARLGILPKFTGVADDYEAPLKPDIVLPAHIQTVDDSVAHLLRTMTHRLALNGHHEMSATPV